MAERIISDIALTTKYLKALQEQFPNVPDSQLFDGALKLASDRRLLNALSDIDAVLLDLSSSLLGLLENEL